MIRQLASLAARPTRVSGRYLRQTAVYSALGCSPVAALHPTAACLTTVSSHGASHGVLGHHHHRHAWEPRLERLQQDAENLLKHFENVDWYEVPEVMTHSASNTWHAYERLLSDLVTVGDKASFSAVEHSEAAKTIKKMKHTMDLIERVDDLCAQATLLLDELDPPLHNVVGEMRAKELPKGIERRIRECLTSYQQLLSSSSTDDRHTIEDHCNQRMSHLRSLVNINVSQLEFQHHQ
eukprot:tig00020553_g10591.t1